MRFQLIDRAKQDFPVHRLCRVLGVSQSGYFAWKDRPASRRQRDDMVMLAHVRSAFALSNGTYGSPRMTRELQYDGFAIGRRRTARMMRENGLRGRQKRRFKRTTDSEHAWPVAPNIIDQDFTATAPNQKWGVDISYVWTGEGWLYLAVVIDLFSRRVIGWAVGDRLHRDLALAALRKALVMRRPPEGLIHHSDRGSQYCSVEYQAELRRHGIRISMSGKEIATTTPWSRRSSRRSNPSWSGAPSSTPVTRPHRPLPAISTASTTPSGATPRSTISAPRSSNEPRHAEQMPLHLSGASPCCLRLRLCGLIN